VARDNDDEDKREARRSVKRKRSARVAKETSKSAARKRRVARSDEGERASRRTAKKRAARREAAQEETRRSRRTKRQAASSSDSWLSRKRREIASSENRRRRSKRPEASAPETDGDVVRTAYSYRGVRYRYGGSSRNGFDCSGFTSHVYRSKGVSLPRTAAQQFGRGKRVGKGELKAGDLVFFETTRRGISHVGIYAGDGKFVHASSGGGRVRVDTLESGYYRNRYRGARRVK
jgi:cell wall-associated NlpC family hydrolase